MTSRLWCALLSVGFGLICASCGGGTPEGPKVLIGATLFDASTGAAVERAVVIVERETFKAVGDQPTLPIPPGSEKIDLTGRFLIPTPVLIPREADPPQFKSQEQLRALLERGERVVKGTPVDSDKIDPALLERIKQNRVVVLPALVTFESEAHNLKRARSNAKTMYDAGVTLAVDGDHAAHREWKFLSEAGLSTEAIVQATTAHAAEAGALRDRGRIATGLRADLYVLKCDPRADVSCLVKVERAMVRGSWVAPPALGEN